MLRYMKWISRQSRCVMRVCNSRNAIIATGIFICYYYWNDGTLFQRTKSLHSTVKNASTLTATVHADHEVFKPLRLDVGNARGFAMKGRRYTMEDRMDAWIGNSGISVFAVFDGHAGEYTVDYVKDEMMNKMKARFELAAHSGNIKNDVEIKEILRNDIMKTDQQLMEKLKISKDLSGSTLLMAVLKGNSLIVANVGDSRGILYMKNGNIVPLSTDHKPNAPKEKKRIEEAGGFVSHIGVWRVGGMLAMSRAMGDYILKSPGYITAEPDCEAFDVTNAEFFILATDGLWDVFSNEEAALFVKDRMNKESTYAADSLAVEAFHRGSTDNISIVVVRIISKDRADSV